MRVLVLGVNDVASAVAWYLWREGYQVIVVSDPMPTVTRRGMAFADAVFDGTVVLEGVVAQRAETVEAVERLLEARTAVPLVIEDDLVELVARYRPDVVIDARMRKRAQPTPLRGLAQLTIGLGPGFVAGALVDVAIETSWEELGAVRWEGANLPLAGEPREIAGHSRDRYVYAPCAGVWRTERRIGEVVAAGDLVAVLCCEGGERYEIRAPISGAIRGLTRDGVPVAVGTKVLEIDPRGPAGQWQGLGERPRRVAEGVLAAITAWRGAVMSREG